MLLDATDTLGAAAGAVLDLPAAARAQVATRPARVADMLQVQPLIAGFAEKGLMLPKTLEFLNRNFREFVVAVDGHGTVLGCGAVRVYTAQLAEVASLAVSEDAHGLGVGRRIVQQLEVEAEKLGIGTLFALTLQDGFFHRLGYRTVQKEMFPLKVWADCRSCSKLHACDEIAVVKEVM
ncbi:MAG: family N-acetyltransferase [Gemmatimonadetes bacterium]|nr:family N-acetyltransferase [Gemmatimonadota bacterium]